MNTVIVPDVFTAANGYTVTKTGFAGRNQAQRFFFRVPAGNPVLKVDMTGPDATAGTGQVRFLRFHPWGLGIDSNASTRATCRPSRAARRVTRSAVPRLTQRRVSGRSRSRHVVRLTSRSHRSR